MLIQKKNPQSIFGGFECPLKNMEKIRKSLSIEIKETRKGSIFHEVSPALLADEELHARIEEEGFQALVDHWVSKKPRVPFIQNEATSDFTTLPFPQKLWKVVESGQFQSVTWDQTGNYVVINKDLIKDEIAAKKGLMDMFSWSSLKSFQRQLQLYGFKQSRPDEQQNKGTFVGKLMFYRSENFKRDFPELLCKMKRRIGVKKLSTA
ncbi:HSFY1 protein, partial [Polypterus senegalus]